MMVARSYRLPSHENPSKTARVVELLPLWQAGLGRSQAEIRRDFFRTGCLPKWVDAKGWDGGLSQRQWNSVNQQAMAAHRSWRGNCERVFRDVVSGSTLPDDAKRDLYYVNKANLWYLPTVTSDSGQLEQVPITRTRAVPASTFRLARDIMRHVRRRVGTPDLRRVRTMVMDGKVATVSPSEVPGADYWVRISTVTTHKTVRVPLTTQAGFSRRLARDGAVVANHCQIVVSKPDRHGKVRVAYRLVVKTPAAEPRGEGRSLGLDWGITTLFATSDGRLYGRGFLDRLKAYDDRLQPLGKALARNGIRLRDSKRYRALIQDISGFVTNEVNRVLNRIADDPGLRELVTEALDFRGLGLSRRLRRILSVAGRATVARKLVTFSEDLGITITEVNPAHTSRECSGCGYTSKSNRTSQAKFTCRFCGKNVHADINGARTVLGRSQNAQAWPHVGRGRVLVALDEQFHARWGVSFADVDQRPQQAQDHRATSRTGAAHKGGIREWNSILPVTPKRKVAGSSPAEGTSVQVRGRQRRREGTGRGVGTQRHRRTRTAISEPGRINGTGDLDRSGDLTLGGADVWRVEPP